MSCWPATGDGGGGREHDSAPLAAAVSVAARQARANVTTIGSWEGDDVSVSAVEAALSELRRHEQRAAVRTSVLTLVAVVPDDGAASAALDVVYDLGARHPSRTIVLVVEAGDDSGDDAGEDGGEPGDRQHSGIDAAASVHVVEHGGRAVCFEDVVLRVRGTARHHLDSVIEPFAIPDLPLVVWLPARLPAPGDPLLAVADRIVVDSRAVAGAGGPGGERSSVLPRIQALARRLPVTDLSWTRLAPWRSLLAGLFEGPVYSPFLREIEEVEVVGNYGPRYLLGGWVSQRLRVPVARVRLAPADHVSITVTAVHRHRTGVFRVARHGAERVIHSSIEIDGGPSVSQALRMRDQWPALALGDALTRMGRDEVYCEALEGALRLRAVA